MKKFLVLAGPTASGKTEAAFELSKVIACEMISCDSMQVYRGMPIATQMPPKRITRHLKTHLVSFLSPAQEYNAALFRKEVVPLIDKILKRKKMPLLVGGTGLYLRALLDGLFESDVSEISKDENLRQRLLSEQETHGGSYLHDKLSKVDPPSAQKIHPNDLRRIVRALEVLYLTGKPMSLQKPMRKGIRNEFAPRIFFLERDRADLYERINRRVDCMMKEGLIEEVKKISRKKISQTAGMALGVREIRSYLRGEMNLDKAVELIKQHSRNYAKRQISWFRHEKDVEFIPVAEGAMAKDIANKILSSFRGEAEKSQK